MVACVLLHTFILKGADVLLDCVFSPELGTSTCLDRLDHRKSNFQHIRESVVVVQWEDRSPCSVARARSHQCATP